MKYYGKLGFYEQREVKPGVWTDGIVEREYYGDLTRLINHNQPTADKVNEDLKLNNQLSVVLDPYALDNFANLRYITLMNSKWKVSAVEVQFPRLMISFGGLYNERTDDPSDV